MIFLNRADHFEAIPLPWQAQTTNAFALLAADLDADAHEDLFLSQNLFALPLSTPRLDAGQSLWLRGDGHGGLTAMTAQETGLALYGEQRSAAVSDFDRDGRVDVAVSQNGSSTRVFRNVGGAVGLRVRLQGGEGNAVGVGAQVRLVYGDGSRGGVRVVGLGSGYWGQSSSVLVLGGGGKEVVGVWVRWLGGQEQEVTVSPGDTEVVISQASRATADE